MRAPHTANARSLGPKPPQPQGHNDGENATCDGAKIWDYVNSSIPLWNPMRALECHQG